jgi:hypothetical protein
MSQWGGERCFTNGLGSDIRVIAHVLTKGFDKFDHEAPIDDLILTHMNGPNKDCFILLDNLRERFIGKPYSTWIDDQEEKMKVYVVCGNDYPDAVFRTEKGAVDHINKMKNLVAPPSTPGVPRARIYWRHYEMELRP